MLTWAAYLRQGKMEKTVKTACSHGMAGTRYPLFHDGYIGVLNNTGIMITYRQRYRRPYIQQTDRYSLLFNLLLLQLQGIRGPINTQ